MMSLRRKRFASHHFITLQFSLVLPVDNFSFLNYYIFHTLLEETKLLNYLSCY